MFEQPMPEQLNEPIDTFEGRLRFGPIKGVDGAYLLEHMPEHNLYFPKPESASIHARMTPDGFLVEIEGPGVAGYLVDEDGIQASESDLEEFAEDLLEMNESIEISGEHLVGKDIKVIHRTIIRMDHTPPHRPGPVAEVNLTRVGAAIGVDNLLKG